MVGGSAGGGGEKEEGADAAGERSDKGNAGAGDGVLARGGPELVRCSRPITTILRE
jgi:hypothetical protein